MPKTAVLFYQETQNVSPVVEWLAELQRTNPKAYAKWKVRIERLAEMGHELRRPECDLLRDGIYELRARLGTVNYLLLYFFQGRVAAVIAHGLTKEAAVPSADLDEAIARKAKFLKNPTTHTFKGRAE